MDRIQRELHGLPSEFSPKRQAIDFGSHERTTRMIAPTIYFVAKPPIPRHTHFGPAERLHGSPFQDTHVSGGFLVVSNQSCVSWNRSGNRNRVCLGNKKWPDVDPAPCPLPSER